MRTVVALACEQRAADAFFGQPASTVSAFAFVLAGLAILAGRSRWQARGYGLLVAAVGIGSVIQHGPHPPWQAYAHDLSLGAVLAYVAVDAARDLSGRRLRAWWWLAPTAALVPFIVIGPGASSAAQVTLAVLAVGLGLLRAAVRPHLRRTLLPALAMLATGAVIGTLGERTALCQPESLLQGHALWHVLAALALWLLTPAIACYRRPNALIMDYLHDTPGRFLGFSATDLRCVGRRDGCCGCAELWASAGAGGQLGAG